MRPFFSFFGGKWRDTPKNYPAPTHGHIVEPFAGSAGYSVRFPHLQVSLFDLDETIVGVWDYLIKASAADILAIGDLGRDQTTNDLVVCQEARDLVGFWLNRGASAPRRSPSRWMRDGIRPGSFWGPRVRETIAGQLEGIRHWRVSHGSFESIPDTDATWFVDPPYQRAGKHYRCSTVDYAVLGVWCQGRSGQVIVCEADGADWLPFTPIAAMKTTRRDRPAIEASWVRAATPPRA